MIYLFARVIWPIWLVVMATIWISMLSDLMFQKKKRKFKDFFLRFVLSLIWPISLINSNGRSIFKNSFRKIFN